MAYNPPPPANPVYKPDKYKLPVGPNYQKYGEQPGYIYDPANDKYVRDTDANREALGQSDKPGLGETLIPVAGAATALGLGQALGNKIPGMFSSGAKEVGESVTQATQSTQAINAPTTTGAEVSGAPSGSPAPDGAGMLGSEGAAGQIVNSNGSVAIGQNIDGTYQFADGTSGMPASDGFMNSGYGQPGGIGGWIGAGLNIYQGAKAWGDSENKGQDERVEDVVAHGARGVAAYGTGGLSEIPAQAIDAVAGEGTTNKIITPLLKYNPVTWGAYPVLNAVMGERTKHTELRNLKRVQDDGYVSEAFLNAMASNAKEFGGRGRKGIDPEADRKAAYDREIAAGKTEEEAQADGERAYQYATFVKEGKDKEADAMLRPQDIVGYANIAEYGAKTTGSQWDTELSEDQRLGIAGAILDGDRRGYGTYYSSKGAPNVRKNPILDAITLRIKAGEKYDPKMWDQYNPDGSMKEGGSTISTSSTSNPPVTDPNRLSGSTKYDQNQPSKGFLGMGS